MRRTMMIAPAVWWLAVGLGGAAHADTIVYDSFNPSPVAGKLTDTDFSIMNITVGSDAGIYQAAAFIPSTTVELTSLTGAWGSNESALPVSLWTDSGGLPSGELESWTASITPSVVSFNHPSVIGYYTLTSAAHPVLHAGQTYWVVTEFPHSTDQDYLSWGIFNGASAGDFDSGFLPFEDFDFGHLDHAGGLEVEGAAVTAAPEPATTFLWAGAWLGLSLAGKILRRKLE